MIAESQVEAGASPSAEENGLTNELPALYANELGRNMPYPRHDSPLKQLEKTVGEAHLTRAQVHAYDFNAAEEGVFPENRSYMRWKSKNNHLFGNSPADMVSDLGKRLESSARILHEPTDRAYLNEDSGPVFSTPYSGHGYQSGQVTATPVRPPYSVPSPNNPAMHQTQHHPMSPLRDPQHNRYYDPEIDAYQRNLHVSAGRRGFDPRHCHDNSPGFKGYDCSPNSAKHQMNLAPNGYPNESQKEFVPYPYDPQMSAGFGGHDFSQTNSRHFNNCLNGSPKGFVPYPYNPQVNPGEKCFVERCNCVNPKCGTPLRKCPCRPPPPPPPEKPRCASERRRAAESDCGEAAAAAASKKKDLSVKRLYRIVWLQNEQLALLQRQIDKLGERLCSAEKPDERMQKITEGNLKVSVGVMTSFVDGSDSSSERDASEKGQKSEVKNIPDKLAVDRSPEEDPKQKTNVGNRVLRVDREESFTLHGIEIPQAEDAHSPQTSFHLDINEYKSDDSSSSSSLSDEESNSSDGEAELPPVGWTFYDSVVGQVNNMLTKSNDVAPNSREDGGLEDIRNATFDQLRQLGVSFVADPESPAQKRVTFNRVYYPKTGVPHQQKSIHTDSDTSMHINALAMKYLKGVQHPLSKSDKMQGLAVCNMVNGGNNLSFATLRYLERYQLVPASGKQTDEPHTPKNIGEDTVTVKRTKGTKNAHRPNKLRTDVTKSKQAQPHCSKILDITAIKQQPKLLPKKLGITN